LLLTWTVAATTQFNIVTQVKGILPIANGGTGLNSLATLVAGGNTVKVANGTSALTAATVTTATCQTAITTAATGTVTTDNIEWAYATAPATADALMSVSAYVTAGNVNFTRCNTTAASRIGTAIVINWRVVR
jgi:hypothetical protein